MASRIPSLFPFALLEQAEPEDLAALILTALTSVIFLEISLATCLAAAEEAAVQVRDL